jgi:hypothetical protein
MMGFYGGNGWDMLLPVAFGLHALFMFAIFLGIVFMFIWAYKALDKKQLKKCMQWFLIVGVIGAILTTGGMFFGAQKFGNVGDFGKWARGCTIFDDVKGTPELSAGVTVPVVK